MNVFFQITIYFLLFYGICVLFIYMRQDHFLFFPPSTKHERHNYKDVIDYSLTKDGATVRGWLVNPKLIKEKLIIYFGGNAEDVFFNIDEFSGEDTVIAPKRTENLIRHISGKKKLYILNGRIMGTSRCFRNTGRLFQASWNGQQILLLIDRTSKADNYCLT